MVTRKNTDSKANKTGSLIKNNPSAYSSGEKMNPIYMEFADNDMMAAMNNSMSKRAGIKMTGDFDQYLPT